MPVVNRKSNILWNSYLACAYAEGFCEGQGASIEHEIEAWSYIIEHNMHLKLQGFYGRNVQHLIENGLVDNKGVINWEAVKEYKR